MMAKGVQLPTASGTQAATSVSNEGEKRKETPIEIKLRRQAKNKLKKDESRRAREEELRRKLYEPKDQRIRVVKHNELEQILSTSQIRGDVGAQTVPNITADDFPSLGKSKIGKPSNKAMHPIETKQISSSSQPHCDVVPEQKWPRSTKATSEVSKSRTSGADQGSCTELNYTQTLTCTPHLKPKRNAPIKIEVLSALKKSKPIAPVSISKPKTKKDSPPKLAGNQLDASNPIRNKGKKREIPKEKKPSNLKLVILQEREIKRSIKQELTNSQDGNGALLEEKHENSIEGNGALLEEKHKKSKEGNGALLEETNDSSNININLKYNCIETPVNSVELRQKVSECVKPSLSSSPVKKEEISRNKVLLQNANSKESEDAADTLTSAKLLIHSRKFREYCDHVLSAELDAFVTSLVTDLVKYQDRLYFNDPIKAHAKRRFVLGFRESKKYLELHKIKMIIIAPDLEKVKSAGGIDDTVEDLKNMCVAQDIPCIFALNRKILKKLTNKGFRMAGISCMGVMNYEGTQDNFHSIMSVLPKLRTEYNELLNRNYKDVIKAEEDDLPAEKEEIEESSTVDVNKEIVSSFLMKLSNEIIRK